MTPTQLRAFAAVVRHGSVKQAAAELNVSEAAVSLHIGQLRKELGDQLFNRTAAGLAFTPGGLRLASRAGELLGLQDRTILEVSQAARGRRLLRVAASSLFAEHAAPGLLELFARSGRRPRRRAQRPQPGPVRHAAADPHGRHRDRAGTGRPRSGGGDQAGDELPDRARRRARTIRWRRCRPVRSSCASRPGCSARPPPRPWARCRPLLRRLAVPEDRQQIFQSHAAAIEEAKRGKGVAPVLSFTVAQDLAHGAPGPARRQRTSPSTACWHSFRLAEQGLPSRGRRAEPVRRPPRGPSRRWSAAPASPSARFRPSIHVTFGADRLDHGEQRPERVRRQQRVAVGQRGGHRGHLRREPRARRPAGSSRSPGARAAAAGPSPRPVPPAGRCPSRPSR